MAATHFWDDQEVARDTIEESNRLKAWVRPWNELSSEADDLSALVELLLTEEDPDLDKELGVGLKALAAGVESMELRTMLQGEDDHREAIVTLQPGAGGLESQDWAEMLLRMYLKWSEGHNFRTEIMELSGGEVAGIKSAIVVKRGAVRRIHGHP